MAKQNVMVAQMKSRRKMKITNGSECVNIVWFVPGYHFAFNSTTITIIERRRNVNVLMNQAVQCNQPGKPIIFIAS